MKITLADLRRFAGKRAKPEILAAIADHATNVLPRYGITSARRMQHFFAQIAHESGGFTIYEESLTYTTTARLRAVWPSRFKSDAAARLFVRNPQKLGNTVYANRMGNGPPASGDGYRYRGRSLAQHTGKDGYAAIERITGLPLVKNPDLANDPAYMLECACAFWAWKNLNGPADRDEILTVTRRWNGGTIGLQDRKAWLARAKAVFTEDLDAEDPAPVAFAPIEKASAPDDDLLAPPPAPPKDWDRNDRPAPVLAQATSLEEAVQQRLCDMGYSPGVVGSKPGGLTIGAIAGFKNDRHLPGEPVIDEALLQELDLAKSEGFKRPIATARATATEKELAKSIPAVRENFFTRLVAKVTAIPSAIGVAIAGTTDSFGDAKGYLSPVRDFFTDMPGWVWFALVGVAALGLWATTHRAGKAMVEDYREARRL